MREKTRVSLDACSGECDTSAIVCESGVDTKSIQVYVYCV